MHDITTERGTLLAGAELWDWCSENPDRWKGDWPEWGYNGGEYPSVGLDCFCCEYSEFVKSSRCKDCQKCPLFGKWTDDDAVQVKLDRVPCEGTGSPYKKWQLCFELEGAMTRAKYDSRAKYAKKIADMHRERLAELDGES